MFLPVPSFEFSALSSLSGLMIGGTGVVSKRTSARLAELGIGRELAELQRIVVREGARLLSDMLGLA